MLSQKQLNEARGNLRDSIARSVKALNDLREAVRGLPRPVRIQPRSITAVSLMGTDMGHNQQGIDPFLTQFMRVVDSNDQEHAVEVVSAQESLDELWNRHERIDSNGKTTALKALMNALHLERPEDFKKLSPVFKEQDPLKRPPSWLQVYRHITEWAVLYQLLQSDFASDTAFVWDGSFRTKVFPRDTFLEIGALIDAAIARQLSERGRKYYLAGLVKTSRVLEKFRLAMALEGMMRQSYPCYVELTGELILKAIEWIEYLSERERATANVAQTTKDIFSFGQMYFVKFGSRPNDPIWLADIWQSQAGSAQQIFGYLLNDAQDGFPTALFPQCLQRARKYAELVDVDADIFNIEFGKQLRAALDQQSDIIDELELQNATPAAWHR
jgi:hypothetical protein